MATSLVVLIHCGCAPVDEERTLVTGESLARLEAELNEIVPKILETYEVPGAAIGILNEGNIWRALHFGMANAAANRPVDSKTAFNIGSISKTVAAWGVMQLVEQGELDLDAPVENYLTRWHLPESEFPHEAVTIRRLLSHTAGLSLHGYPGFEPSEKLPTIEESLSGATNGSGAVYVAHEPGSKWQYSGGGYTVAQLIVEEVTGQTFADYMDSRVLGPLGMHDSSFPWDEDVDRIAAQPYGSVGEPIPGPRFTAQAAASLKTTLEDFLRFARASLGTLEQGSGTIAILSNETLQLMQTVVAPSNNYGLGYTVAEIEGVTFVGHGGANAGWRARFEVAPGTGHGIVVMTNGSNGSAVIRTVTCEWRAIVTHTPCTNSTELPSAMPVELLEKYAGRYQLGDDVLTLTVESGRLTAADSDGDRERLHPREDGNFFLSGYPMTFEFELDASGTVTAIVLKEPRSESRAVKIQ